MNWWTHFFGLSIDSKQLEPEEAREQTIPIVPRAGKKKIEIAVRDFLTVWLVEQNPVDALAYIARRAHHCMELKFGEQDQPYDYGMAPLQMGLRMKAVNETLGFVENLADVVTGIRLVREGLSVIEQRHHQEFVLYGVPDHLAARFDCANRLRVGVPPEEPSRPQRKFDYYGTAFYLHRKHTRGETVLLLWAKEQGYWRIVSYEVDPGASEEGVSAPDLRPPEQSTTVVRQPGDPELIAAVDRFYEEWLVKKDYETAFNTFLPQCYPCMNLYLEDNEKSEDPQDQAKRLREALSNLGEKLGPVQRLSEKIRGAELWDPATREIIHEREDTYRIYSVSDWMAKKAECQFRLENKEVQPRIDQTGNYGRYFGSGFTVQTLAGEPAALWLSWTKKTGRWRVFAFEVLAPYDFAKVNVTRIGDE